MKKLVLVFLFALAGTALADEPRVPEERTGHPTYNVTEARKACTDAMNSDPIFAQDIIATVDKQIDQKTLAAHQDAAHHIEKNEKHVIYAYAAMWIVGALFLAFLFMRQQALKDEIARLRKDLEAAAKDAK